MSRKRNRAHRRHLAARAAHRCFIRTSMAAKASDAAGRDMPAVTGTVVVPDVIADGCIAVGDAEPPVKAKAKRPRKLKAASAAISMETAEDSPVDDEDADAVSLRVRLRVRGCGLQAITEKWLRPITGERFAVARRLAGFDQLEAAAALGYVNSSQLSKIESGTSGAQPHMVLRAALVYGVSMDFLTGLSDYPERDNATIEQLAIMRSIRVQVTECALEATKRISAAADDTPAMLAHLGKLRNLAGSAWKELCIVDQEPSFELVDLRDALGSMVDAADDANEFLRRRRAMKAYEHLEHVELDSPLLALVEGGKAGLIGALDKRLDKQLEPV